VLPLAPALTGIGPPRNHTSKPLNPCPPGPPQRTSSLAETKSCWGPAGPSWAASCNPGERRDRRPSRLSCKKVARYVHQRPPNQLPDRVSSFGEGRPAEEGWLRPRIGHWQASLTSHLFESRPTGTARVPTIGALFHAGLQTWCELDLQQPHPGRGPGGVPGGLSHDDGPKIRLQTCLWESTRGQAQTGAILQPHMRRISPECPVKSRHMVCAPQPEHMRVIGRGIKLPDC
jgi:hypothetical protein